MPDRATLDDDPRPGIERIEGELDAGLASASAAELAYQTGNPELGAARRADAIERYEMVVEALPAANATGAQLQDAKAKLIRLRQLLVGFPQT